MWLHPDSFTRATGFILQLTWLPTYCTAVPSAYNQYSCNNILAFSAALTLTAVWADLHPTTLLHMRYQTPKGTIYTTEQFWSLQTWGKCAPYLQNVLYMGTITLRTHQMRCSNSWWTCFNSSGVMRRHASLMRSSMWSIFSFHLVHHGLQMPPTHKNQVGWGPETSDLAGHSTGSW
jgi:hypothetical protein